MGRTARLMGSAALMAAGWAGSAAAFGGNTVSDFMLDGGAGCMVFVHIHDNGAGNFSAHVGVTDTVGFNSYAATGNEYGSIGPAPVPALTATDLTACGLTNVTNLTQRFTGTNAVDGSYLGFSFRATDPADGKTYDYEYALSGATNTVVIQTKVEYVPPAPPGPQGPTAEEVIANLEASRANALLQNQPDLVGLLDAAAPSVTMGGTDATGMMTSAMAYGPVWGKLSASWSNEAGADSRYMLGALGAQAKMGDNAALGMMLQFDHIKQTDAPSIAEGKGWLVGPYAVARLPDHELTFEGRALWGKTSNDISPLGTYSDSVDGTRSLVMVKVSTRVDVAGLAVRPRLSAAQVHEKTKAYTDGGGNAVPEVTTTLNQVLAGVEVQKVVTTGAGALTLTGALDEVWVRARSNVNGTGEGSRGRLSLGLGYDMGVNGALSLSGFYDGIGKSGYNARGLSASYVLKF